MAEKPQPTDAFREGQGGPVGIHVLSQFIGQSSI
jgi:hypothetical protein